MLDNGQAVALSQTLNSDGWRVLIVPHIRDKMMADINLLTSLKRPEGVTDDFLRGRIDLAKTVIGGFNAMLLEHAANAENAKRQDTEVPAIGSPYAQANPDA